MGRSKVRQGDGGLWEGLLKRTAQPLLLWASWRGLDTTQDAGLWEQRGLPRDQGSL